MDRPPRRGDARQSSRRFPRPAPRPGRHRLGEGFDIIYACQDARFDADHGLQSIPARLGVPKALVVSKCLHAATMLLLASLPAAVPALGPIYWIAYAAIALLLVWEHSLVKPDDLSRVNQAFFTANAVIGLVLLAAIAADLWL